MKERIIVISGINGTELLRGCARRSKGMLGVRIMNPAELARETIYRAGRGIKGKPLSVGEIASLIYSKLNMIEIYKNASYADALEMAKTLNVLRKFCVDPKEESLFRALRGGVFADRNRALRDVYKCYREDCARMNLYDNVDLLRMGMETAEPFDAEITVVEEYPLLPLEEALVRKIGGGNIKSIHMYEVYGREKDGTEQYERMTKAFGIVNETEYVLDTIRQNKIPFDQCTIVLPQTAGYAQTLYEYGLRGGIPMSFATGISMMNSNPARLLVLRKKWLDGFCGIDALRALMTAPELDRKKLFADAKLEAEPKDLEKVVQLAGSLRLGISKADSRTAVENYRKTLPSISDAEERVEKEILLNQTAAIMERFTLSARDFVNEYSRIRFDESGYVDLSARKAITDTITIFTKYSQKPEDDIIRHLLRCACAAEQCRAGAIHVCGITEAAAHMTDYIFIMGMSAANFPGRPTESYLLSDDDMRVISDSDLLPVSTQKIDSRVSEIHFLTRLANAVGSKVYVSYSNMDLAELKDANPSSVLFEMYRTKNGPDAGFEAFEKNEMTAVGYFDHVLQASALVGKGYKNGLDPEIDWEVPENAPCPTDIDSKKFSPSAIDCWLTCEVQYYFKYILKIDPVEEDDPMTVISAADRGTLVHNCMETLANTHDTEAALVMADKLFDEFLNKRVPVTRESTEREKRLCREMVRKGCEMDPGREVAEAEMEVEVMTDEGIKLFGRVDRLEKLGEKYVIVDFKTSKKASANPDDLRSCIQTLIYAYALEKKGYTIDHCEYRYVRFGETVSIPYTDGAREFVKQTLRELSESLSTGEYIRAKDKPGKNGKVTKTDPACCTYCKVKEICGKAAFING